MNKNHSTSKLTGNTLSAQEWNNIAADVNELGSHVSFDAENKHNLTIETTVGDQYLSGSKMKGGKINIEPIADLQVKPGDDIALYAHHRASTDRDAVMVKVLTETVPLNGENSEEEIPALLKINSGDITINSKDNISSFILEIKNSYKKTPDFIIDKDFTDSTFVDGGVYKSTDLNAILVNDLTINVFEGDGVTTSSWSTVIVKLNNTGVGKTKVIKYTDGTITKFYKFTRVADTPGITNIYIEGDSGKGYLKVRAQAIDLRCENHGGIALQPKGEDGQGHMNKIKFEHGGGDGLEFGTFNTEKTSLYTKEYRFNKDGKILLAKRTPQVSSKYDGSDETTHYVYPKQTDDFYDEIYEGETGSEFYNYDPTDVADTSITWGDLIKFIAWAKANKQGKEWASIWP